MYADKDEKSVRTCFIRVHPCAICACFGKSPIDRDVLLYSSISTSVSWSAITSMPSSVVVSYPSAVTMMV